MFVTSLLRGNAHQMIYPHIVNDRIDFNTIKELWDVLDCAYKDLAHQGTAEQELAMLKQATREFSAYFADFQRIMAKLKWDPSANKAALRKGMDENLKDLLLTYDHPHSEQEHPGSTLAINHTASTTHITSNPTYLGLAPMDPPAAQKQAERVRIHQERHSGGLCTRCGTAGRFRAACARSKRRPFVTAEVTITPPRVEEAPTAGKD